MRNGIGEEGEAVIRTASAVILLLFFFGAEIGLVRAAESKKPAQMSEQDIDYLLKGIETEKKTNDLARPENETQRILSESMKELNALVAGHTADVSRFEPFEFSIINELAQKGKVPLLSKNLRGYWGSRKEYYDQKDEWLKKYRKILGKTQSEGRLYNTADYYFEQLEQIYVNDLNAFYNFVLKHHSKMVFKKNEIFMEDITLVGELNELWDKVAKSAGEIAKAREGGAKIMIEGLETLKKERGVE